MKISSRLKKPFGTAKMVDIIHVRYLDWEDAFDVKFEDGLSFLEPHAITPPVAPQTEYQFSRCPTGAAANPAIGLRLQSWPLVGWVAETRAVRRQDTPL